MPFIRKHPPLLLKSVLLPRTTYGLWARSSVERRIISRKNQNGRCTLVCHSIPTFIANRFLTSFSPSLTTILQKRVLASEKLDEIKMKANVLAAFAAEKAADARDAIERAIEDL